MYGSWRNSYISTKTKKKCLLHLVFESTQNLRRFSGIVYNKLVIMFVINELCATFPKIAFHLEEKKKNRIVLRFEKISFFFTLISSFLAQLYNYLNYNITFTPLTILIFNIILVFIKQILILIRVK